MIYVRNIGRFIKRKSITTLREKGGGGRKPHHYNTCQKYFEKCQHYFIITAHSILRREGHFLNMIKGPHEKPTASIIFNSERLNTLTLWSDTAFMTAIHCSKVLAREIKEELYIRHPDWKRWSKTVSTYKWHDYVYWKSQINMKKLPVLINKLSEAWGYKISVQKSLMFHCSEKFGKDIKKTVLLTIVLSRKINMNNKGWPRQNGCKIISKPHFRHAQCSPRELTYLLQKLSQGFFPSPAYML